jgi:hypothetical protein
LAQRLDWFAQKHLMIKQASQPARNLIKFWFCTYQIVQNHTAPADQIPTAA